MALENFLTDENSKQDSDETSDSNFKNCRTERLSDPDSLDTPKYVTEWISSDELLAMMIVHPEYFRDNVSEEVKDKAKEKGLVHLDYIESDPIIVLVDDPEEYGSLLIAFGLESYLRKRCNGVI